MRRATLHVVVSTSIAVTTLGTLARAQCPNGKGTEKVSGRNGTAACVTRVYGDFSASSSARAWARGLVRRACGFGRRFSARGSMRPGRWPTM